MTTGELFYFVKNKCGFGVEYLHIKPTAIKIGGKVIMAEYITPSWFGEEVFINYRTDKVSSKKMTDEECQELANIINSQYAEKHRFNYAL